MKIPFVNFKLYQQIIRYHPEDSTPSKPENSNEFRPVIKTDSRSSTIVPRFVGATISVHTGKRIKKLTIEEKMVGYKLGAFVFTKKLGKSIHNSEHNRKKIAKIRRKITQKKIRKAPTASTKNKKKKKR